MFFAFNVALRYLAANKVQSGLLIFGVALGVTVFVFITALIKGLAIFLVAQTTGSIAHITIEPPVRIARILGSSESKILAAQPVSTVQRAQLRSWREAMAIAGGQPGVLAVRPEIVGNAFIIRGEATAPVSLQGLPPEQLDAISPISTKIIEGNATLSADSVLIGKALAVALGLRAGQPILVRSERGGQRLLTIRGIFETGLGSLDERVGFVAQSTARPLFNLPDGVNQVVIKLENPDRAPKMATKIRSATGLKVTPWQEKNRQLQSALEGQGRTGSLIQIFSMISIIIGIASALLLSTYRRRGEIGIMRSFGVSKGFVAAIFIWQGLLIGVVGALIGCGLGYWLCTSLAGLKDSAGDTLLPVAPLEGGYALVFALTTLGSVVAALLPARSAARLDPVEAISQ